MHSRTAVWLALVAVLALTATACQRTDGSSGDGPSPPGDGTAEPTPGPAPSGPELVMDWRAAFALTLPNGLAVRDCDGERLSVCVHREGALLGDIELLPGYPLTEEQAALEPEALRRVWAADFLAHFGADRSRGCPGFTFTPDEVTDAVVGGQAATRASFTLTDGTGRVAERVINYFALRDDTMTLVNIDAYLPDGGCLGPSEYDPSFTPDALAEVEPYLDRLLAGTPLVDTAS